MDAMGGAGESSVGERQAAIALPVLDVESAISRMLGSRSLYISMIEMFRTQLMTDLGQVQQALAVGNRRDALRLIHSTKGAAKILGAERLGEASDRAYEAVRQDHGDNQADAMAELLRCAATTVDAVEEFLGSRSG
ncbi:MAG TPA: Hpt domain-containing protein [Pseudomonadota bacterium]|nr:Hpt domain-containing protein [Pseudomonadota bacterium]